MYKQNDIPWLKLPITDNKTYLLGQVQRSLQVVPTALRGTVHHAVGPTVPGAAPAMAFGSAMLGEPGWYAPAV